MSQSISSADRTIVPRWVPTSTIGAIDSCPDDYSLVSANLIDDRTYHELSKNWNERTSLTLASELVSIGILLNKRDPQILASAQYVLNCDQFVPSVIHKMAEEIIDKNKSKVIEDPDSKFKSVCEKIHSAKIKIRQISNNPFIHLDLALLYTTLGQIEKAHMHIRMANSFKHYSPHILRFSARFAHHTKIDVEMHLQALRKSFAESNDPLIAAAEIGISNSIKKSSRLLDKARKMIFDKGIPEWRRSELATLIGMDELRNGSRKKSEEAFNVALRTSNENSLTQIAILNESRILKLSGYNLQNQFIGKEALTWISYLNGDYENAIKYARQWQEFQPFSAKPSVLISYIESCINHDYINSIETIKLALIPSPNNFVLNNNAVFSYCHLGSQEQASNMLSKLKRLANEPEHDAFVLANMGLYEYKFGDQIKGREFYKKAIESFKALNDIDREIRANVYYAREEIKYSKENTVLALKRINDLAKRTSSREVVNLVEKEVNQLQKQISP